MPRFNEMPPALNEWPKPVAALAAELAELQEKAAQANRDITKLTGDGSDGARSGILLALRKADEEGLGLAARNGTALPDTRPATEQYEIDVEAARTAVNATEGAVVAVGDELQAALIDHADAIDTAVTEQTDAAVNAYVAAINALEIARIDVKRAAATDGFLERARRARPDQWVNFASHFSPDMAGSQHSLGGTNFDKITEGLRSEAAYHRPAADETPNAA
jgi:hypothetical protein